MSPQALVRDVVDDDEQDVQDPGSRLRFIGLCLDKTLLRRPCLKLFA